jgi:hypothetical protein
MTRQNQQQQNQQPEDNEEEYYALPVFDQPIHTPDHLFCDDPTCPCHDDAENMETLQEWYEEGLIGPVDGDLIYRGQTLA